MANLTNLLLILSLSLLTSCVSASVESNYKVLVSVQSPETIRELGKKYGFKNTRGLAFHNLNPCYIVVPPLTVDTVRLWRHELKHCVEGSFHN